jgi:hypothetical protein
VTQAKLREKMTRRKPLEFRLLNHLAKKRKSKYTSPLFLLLQQNARDQLNL